MMAVSRVWKTWWISTRMAVAQTLGSILESDHAILTPIEKKEHSREYAVSALLRGSCIVSNCRLDALPLSFDIHHIHS
jgi:hypothetical protein